VIQGKGDWMQGGGGDLGGKGEGGGGLYMPLKPIYLSLRTTGEPAFLESVVVFGVVDLWCFYGFDERNNGRRGAGGDFCCLKRKKRDGGREWGWGLF